MPPAINPIPLEIFLIIAFFKNSSLAKLRVCYDPTVSLSRNIENRQIRNTLAHTLPPILPLSSALPRTPRQSSIAFSSATDWYNCPATTEGATSTSSTFGTFLRLASSRTLSASLIALCKISSFEHSMLSRSFRRDISALTALSVEVIAACWARRRGIAERLESCVE